MRSACVQVMGAAALAAGLLTACGTTVPTASLQSPAGAVADGGVAQGGVQSVTGVGGVAVGGNTQAGGALTGSGIATVIPGNVSPGGIGPGSGSESLPIATAGGSVIPAANGSTGKSHDAPNEVQVFSEVASCSCALCRQPDGTPQ